MKQNLKKGFKHYDPRTRQMRKASMAEAYATTTMLICQPTGFSGDVKTRVDAKGNKISRKAFRDYRHAHPAKPKGAKYSPKGVRQDARVGQGLAGCGAARRHYENIGLGMVYSNNDRANWRNRYRGGAWNK